MSNQHISLQEQTGGWFNVSIATLEELVFCPDILTNDNASSIVINPGPTTVNIYPVGESIIISETPQKTSSGLIYNINSQFDIPIQSKDLDTYFNDCIQKKVVLIGIKHDGQQKLYGSKRFPLTFSYKFINGKKYEDSGSIRVTVSGKVPQKPVFIAD